MTLVVSFLIDIYNIYNVYFWYFQTGWTDPNSDIFQTRLNQRQITSFQFEEFIREIYWFVPAWDHHPARNFPCLEVSGFFWRHGFYLLRKFHYEYVVSRPRYDNYISFVVTPYYALTVGHNSLTIVYYLLRRCERLCSLIDIHSAW